MDAASPLLEKRAVTGSSSSSVVLLSTAAATGGLLFGFDTAVISGAQRFFESEFALTPAMTGWVVGSVLIGCMIGAAGAGWVADRFGRKPVLLLSAVLFFISAVWCGVARSTAALVWARWVGGIGVGIASMLAPMYIAEISPARVRGRLVGIQQLAIVVGILLAFFSNAVILNTALDDRAKWRWMFAVEAVPAAAYFLFLLPIPESPRWMVQRGRRSEAQAVLARIGGAAEADRQLLEIEAAIATEVGTLGELLGPGLRWALLVGVVLAVLQQVSGINAIMYYAPRIFESAGSLAASAFAQSVLVGLINVIFTLLGMALVDRVGRKPLLVLGAAGMGVSLVLVGAALAARYSGVWLLAPILGYVAFFAATTGVVTWVIISEIFPNRVRGRAMSIAVVALWAACYLVSQTFPMLLASVGASVTFFGYAVMNLVTLAFAWIAVPETKGKSLEVIERLWRRETPS